MLTRYLICAKPPLKTGVWSSGGSLNFEKVQDKNILGKKI